MTKTKIHPIFIVLLVLGAFWVGGTVIAGMTIREEGGEGTNPIDINEIADLYVGTEGGEVTSGSVVYVDKTYGGVNSVNIQVSLDSGRPQPDVMRIDLVLDNGQVIYSHDLSTLGWSDFYRFFSGSFKLDACPTGVFGAEFVFSGGWVDEDNHIVSPLDGNSVRFILDRTSLAKPSPATVNVLTRDTTIPANSYFLITWEWSYTGPVNIRVVDDMSGFPQVLRSVDLEGSSIKQEYNFNYFGRYSGVHEVSLLVTPTDMSGNEPVSDTCRIIVDLGGEQLEFPPTVERVDIVVSKNIYNEELRQDYSWSLFSEAPDYRLSQTTVDGDIRITVNVVPADSLTMCEVRIGENIFPMDFNTGTWTVDINTDLLSEGIHTIEVHGIDRGNGYSYLLGEFPIGVRTQSTNPLIFVGAIVGIGIVVLFVVLRRKR